MIYLIEDHFLSGMPQTILPNGLLTRGLVGHWTAGATGRQGALGTARFLVEAASRNASYHEIWWWDPTGEGTFGVLRIVDMTRAAHSMNPNPPDWDPGPNVHRLLGDGVWDPNAWSYAASFAGMPADIATACADPRFIAGAIRRTQELVAQEPTLTDPQRPWFIHGEGQPSTRYDWGTELLPKIYAGLETPTEEELMPTAPLNLQIGKLHFAGGKTYAFVRRAPGDPADPALWTDRRTYVVPAGGSSADGDGPWLLNPYQPDPTKQILRNRSRNGTYAGYYGSSVTGGAPPPTLVLPVPPPPPNCDAAVAAAVAAAVPEAVAAAVAPLNDELDDLQDKITAAIAALS